MPTAIIKQVDMEKPMEEKAILTARAALDECNTPDEIADYMKKTFENEYGHIWHCFVGRHFASYCTHEKGKYIYFYIGHNGFCLFSSG